MKKSALSLIVGLFIFSSAVRAQEKEMPELRESDFQFTFMFPPLSTNWVHNSKTVNKFSLNLFVGNAGAVDGVELGGFINSINYYMNGFQGAGFGNIVGDSVNGAQLAGFFNINGGAMEKFQGAGFVNVAGGNVSGCQASGFGNVSGGLTSGAQVAGFFNVAERYEKGAQIAGFVNVSGGKPGAQLSGFCNTAQEIKGAQMAGFINVAGNVKGLQMAGFINVCDSIDGVPIAFISVVKKNGYRHFDFSVSETQYINFSYRMGVRHFHSIYSIGKPTGPGNRWLIGFGMGGHVDIRENMSLNIEALVHQELWIADSRSGNLLHIDRLNLLNQFRALYAYRLSDRTEMFFGPTLNVAVAETNPDLGFFAWNEIGPNWAFYNRTQGNTGMTNVKIWFGITGGIRL
jgi:hypothetical protein